jgi:hypothetical protein
MPGAPGPIDDTGKFMTIYQVQPGGELTIKLEMWNSDISPWASTGQQGRAGQAVGDFALNDITLCLKDPDCD